MGTVTGTFVADEDYVKTCIGKRVYFGEILGKHSEIYGTLDEKDLTIITDDQEFIEKVEKYKMDSIGHNPLRNLVENQD
jgi:hypothetical protein